MVTKKSTRNEKVCGKFYIIQRLNPEKKESLMNNLYALLLKLFGKVDEAVFYQFFRDPRIKSTYLATCLNSENEFVGFFTLHVFRLSISNKKHLIFRGQTGLLRKYRRNTVNVFYLLFIILYQRILNPFCKMYIYSATLNPGIYRQLSRVLKQIIPGVNQPVSNKYDDLIEELLKFYNQKRKTDSWVTNISVFPKTSKQEDEYWKESKDPHIKFFLDLNPNYKNGDALITLVPLTWFNILSSSIMVIAFFFKRTSRHLRRYYMQPVKRRLLLRLGL